MFVDEAILLVFRDMDDRQLGRDVYAPQLSERSGYCPPPVLVTKTVAQLDVDLSRLGKVRAAERVRAVQQESIVSQVHGL